MSYIAENLTSTIALILLGIAAVALVEAAIPLRNRSHWNRAHLGPNLVLTVITLLTNALLNTAVVFFLIWLEDKGWGPMNALAVGPLPSAVIVVLGLDLLFYAAHVAMHKLPILWRFHRVHHSDPALDVTTSIRQHPGEGLFRYLTLFVGAAALGASPGAFAVYRVSSVLNALLEHANIRLPPRLDTALSWVTTWPNMHKVHHSRKPSEADSNYGNLFSWWDRMFSTFTPAHVGATVVFGLDGLDSPEQQSTTGLLAMPFAETSSDAAAAVEVSS